MKQNRPFKESISNGFEEAFYYAIGRYTEENIGFPDLSSIRVHNIDNAEVSEVTVKNVSVNDQPQICIAFEVIAEYEKESSMI